MRHAIVWQKACRGEYSRFVYMILGMVLVALHYAMFNELFPNANKALGHDYALFFPALLDGTFWQTVNGVWQTPWFTPSFCGGVPKFANPNAGFYSVPQFLNFIFSPLSSVKLTFVLFAGLGYWGFYLLLRRVFNCHRHAALLGAALFLFNGFYAYRIAIGHLTYHGFMLIPWIAYFVLHDISARKSYHTMRCVMYLVAASVLISYMVLSGMINLILPGMIAVAVIVLIKMLYVHQREGLTNGSGAPVSKQYDIEKLAAVSVIALALSASQIVATQSFLHYFPRDFYPLPGVPNILDMLHVIFKILFIEPDNALAEKVRVNVRWAADRHEHELSVSIIPLLVLLLFVFSTSLGVWLGKFRNFRATLLLLAIFTALLLPIVVNFYSPSWNAILKKTPVIGSSSTLVRWYCLYIPVVILLAALAFDNLKASKPKIMGLTTFFVVLLLVTKALENKEYYHKQNYPINTVSESYKQLKSGDFVPQVQSVSSGGNLRKGESSINCYEPIFGYLKEAFPMKTLHAGPALKSAGGVFNIKNPACYLYPKENNCQPGDHFLESQKEQAEQFLSYKPFAFKVSSTQFFANILTKVFWSVSVVVLALGLSLLVLRRFKRFLLLLKVKVIEE